MHLPAERAAVSTRTSYSVGTQTHTQCLHCGMYTFSAERLHVERNFFADTRCRKNAEQSARPPHLFLRRMRQWFDRLSARHILLLCIGSAVARLVYVLVVAPPIPTAEDYAIAQHLARGEGFCIYDRGPTSIKGPIYPAYLAFWLWGVGDPAGLRWAVAVQHLVLAAVPWVLWRLGVRLGQQGLGVGAALLFAGHPSYFYHATVAENTAWVVAVGALWCLLVAKHESWRWWRGFAVGVVVGVFALEKPPLVVPLLVAVAIARRSWWRDLLPVALGIALVIGSWAVRGYLVFGEPMLTRSYSGYLTFIHSWLPSMAIAPRYSVPDTVERELAQLAHVPESSALPRLRELARGILAEKWHLLPERTALHALVYWTIPPRYWGNWSAAFVVGRVLPVAVLLVLSVVGSRVLWRRDRRLLVAIVGVLVWTTLFYSFYHVLNIRYKLEVEWLQLFVCAAALCRVENRGEANFARSSSTCPL